MSVGSVWRIEHRAYREAVSAAFKKAIGHDPEVVMGDWTSADWFDDGVSVQRAAARLVREAVEMYGQKLLAR